MPAPIPLDPAKLRKDSENRDEVLNYGTSLSERSINDGGWAEYFDGDLNPAFAMEDPVLKAQTAVMLENSRKWMNTLDESTLSLSVGGYRDFIFPIVRAAFPNNPINELVSVQPQTRKNGTIYWLNYVIGNTRGQFQRGQTLFDANNGWSGITGYTDNAVTGEASTAAVAGAPGGGAVTGTVVETPVFSGRFEVVVNDGATAYTLRDDGNGSLTLASKSGAGVLTLSSGTINYVTGAWAATFSGNFVTGGAVALNYVTDNEGQYVRAQIDVEMQSAGIQAIRRPIAMRVSMESMQDFQAEMGMDLSQTIITGAAQQIMADVGGDIIKSLWSYAGAAVSTFSVAVPSGINMAEHFRDIIYPIQQASGAITDATQRGEATWLVVDQNALNILITAGAAGGFIREPNTAKGQGLVRVGTFNGLSVFRWKFLSSYSGASANGNILVGYKGPDWWDAGYVFSPYQQFYTNGPDERADLTRRQAFAMRYATKLINANMYKRVSIVP